MRLALAALALAASVAHAQASDADKHVTDGGVTVDGWTGRLDPRAAGAGKTLSDVKFYPMSSGFHVTAGPPGIYWNPANTAEGMYTVSATFAQTKASTHPEAYGLFIAGQNLEASNQSYLYFVIRQDGKYLINHRADDSTVHKIVDWTANKSVRAMAKNGKATNRLAIVVGPNALSFRVNGKEVRSLPRSTIDSGGSHSGTTGIAGLRVNHNLDVHVSGFSVAPGRK